MSTSRADAPSRSAFSAPGFTQVWLCGMCWHWARWGIAFLAAFQINEMTDSPRLVQLTGTAMWGPLLFGGILGGLVADRFDRARTIRTQLMVLIPLVCAVGVLVNAGRLRTWMVYPFLVVAGIGWVGDMTSRRALVYDLVGPDRIDNANAFEAIALASGVAVGNLLGGTAADAVGVGPAFFVVAALLVIALALMTSVPSPPDAQSLNVGSVRHQLREGLQLMKTSRGLRCILGVTVIANFFFFAYFPAVQRIGERLGASPTGIGVLASMTGFGMMAGSGLMAWREPRRRGALYVTGVFMGMALLVPFALAGSLPVAIGALFVASIGGGFFGSTQATLVMALVPREVRGRAMGLLSMAIGALPVGTFLLGEIAEEIGARKAVVSMAGAGTLALLAWLGTHRELLAMESSKVMTDL